MYRYAERYATTGEVRPFVRRNGPTRELNEFEEHFLANLVLAKPEIYLRELQEELCVTMLHWVHSSTILRTLHRIGMSRQVLKHRALRCSELPRSKFWLEFHYFDPSMIVWIDVIKGMALGNTAMELEDCLLMITLLNSGENDTQVLVL